ncbi:hypothetical protein [Streptomyces sp. NPDC054849]
MSVHTATVAGRVPLTRVHDHSLWLAARYRMSTRPNADEGSNLVQV